MAINLDDAKDGLDKVDSILTKIGKILRKHWLTILILLIGWFFYYALTTPLEEEGTGEETELIEEFDEVIIDDDAYQYQSH